MVERERDTLEPRPDGRALRSWPGPLPALRPVRRAVRPECRNHSAEHRRAESTYCSTSRASTGPQSIPSKRFEDFRAVRDVKVRGYRNLVSALGDNVGTWCNFGSIIGFTGQSGETDYAAANDFLITAAQAAATHGRKEVTIGWGLWRDAGIGADPVHRSFLEKSGKYTGMSSAEGVYHFLREMLGTRATRQSCCSATPSRESLEDYRPGYLAAGSATVISERNPRSMIRAETQTVSCWIAELRGTPSQAEYERCFDLDRDAYLAEHVVLGHPTLPGTFVTEIAAEAAVDLVGGRVPVAFEDITLSSFLRVYDRGRPVRKRITAQLLHHDERIQQGAGPGPRRRRRAHRPGARARSSALSARCAAPGPAAALPRDGSAGQSTKTGRPYPTHTTWTTRLPCSPAGWYPQRTPGSTHSVDGRHSTCTCDQTTRRSRSSGCLPSCSMGCCESRCSTRCAKAT